VLVALLVGGVCGRPTQGEEFFVADAFVGVAAFARFALLCEWKFGQARAGSQPAVEFKACDRQRVGGVDDVAARFCQHVNDGADGIISMDVVEPAVGVVDGERKAAGKAVAHGGASGAVKAG